VDSEKDKKLKEMEDLIKEMSKKLEEKDKIIAEARSMMKPAQRTNSGSDFEDSIVVQSVIKNAKQIFNNNADSVI